MKTFLQISFICCLGILLAYGVPAAPKNSLLYIVGKYKGRCIWDFPVKGSASKGWAELKIQHDEADKYYAKLTYQAGKNSMFVSRAYFKHSGNMTADKKCSIYQLVLS